MANGYKVTLKSAFSDGTNIYAEIEIYANGVTLPIARPIFKVGTAAATITSYMQTVANNGGALAADVAAIVGSSVTA